MPTIAGVLLGGLFASGATFAASLDPGAAFDQAISRAETSLQGGEPQVAESHYRSALLAGWLLMGTLERLDGRLPEAREAFKSASISVVENKVALQALAFVDLQMGNASQAISILRPLAESGAKDAATRRLLAQALAASGEAEQSVQELEAAHAAAPDDLEISFALGRGYLELKKIDLAARLFDQILAARAIPQTSVLVGRTYSDFAQYDRARAELRAALKRDPRVRRAHYYLGVVAVREGGQAGLDEAILEFQAELRLAPDDLLANLELGAALVDIQRAEEALPALEIAARGEPVPRVLYYLGRAQLARGQAADAVVSLERALAGARAGQAKGDVLRTIHIQLGQALRRLGRTDEAAGHFAEAERTSAEGMDAARERMTRYLTDSPPETEAASSPAVPMLESSPLAALTPSQRLELRGRLNIGMARAYLNLGVMKAQGQRFAHAAQMFEMAAKVDPTFPQVQSSLGVAYFNAKQFDKAVGPLGRAIETTPDPQLKRLLAMAWLNTEAYDQAAELLALDPERLSNPSLQFAYGLALVKGGRAAEAERIFSGLLAQNGDSPELNVLLGQAHAAQGDFDSAIARFKRALELKSDVPEAYASLGVIYWKQGRPAEAEVALRAELRARPNDVQSQQNLAVVLESQQRPEEALGLLRSVLQARPELADARYLLGKILLAQGDAEGAVPQLEAAVRLSPDDASGHYQLGRAYQKLGRTEPAERELEIYRRIKDTRR